VAAEEGLAVEVAPPVAPTTPAEWVRRNLFSSPFNGALSVLVLALTGYLAFALLRWLIFTADWEVFRTNLRVYMVGRFPLDEIWRVWASVYLVAALAGLSLGASGTRLAWTPRKVALRVVLAAVGVVALVYLLEGLRIWMLFGAVVAVLSAGVVVGRRTGRRLLRLLVVPWVLAFPAVIVLLRGFGGVPPLRWGGFLLNVLVAFVAIFLSFPVGILLALGRRSTLPVVSKLCVGFIELIRGAPLVTWLIFGQYVLLLFLPQMSLDAIIRAMAAMTLFSSAYVAEIVRGGLQGIPAGQYEAARAVGLSTTRMMALIILPQALRATIPAMISHFISLFKDTSLLNAIGGFTDLLGAARRAVGVTFIGHEREALLSAAIMFWLVAFSMSRWSQRLERRLGVGER
jgi:general L-amino acid transport system permease protein